MLTYAFSDSHIGVTANYDKFHQFLDVVESEKPDRLIGVGDIIELVWTDFDNIMAWEPSRSAVNHLKQVAESGVPTSITPGNHDRDILEYATELKPIEIRLQTLFWDKLFYTHGHQFDPLEKGLWKWICKSPLRYIAPGVYHGLYGSPYSLKQSGKDTSYSRLVGIIEAGMNLWLGSVSGVFGHTHSEFIRERRGQQIANCGDFVDSASFLIIKDGKVSLRWV